MQTGVVERARRCSDFAPEKLRVVYENAEFKVLD
jgi:hypothetical protein